MYYWKYTSFLIVDPMSLGSVVLCLFSCIEPVIPELRTACKFEVFVVDVYSDYGVLGCDAVYICQRYVLLGRSE